MALVQSDSSAALNLVDFRNGIFVLGTVFSWLISCNCGPRNSESRGSAGNPKRVIS